MNTTIAASSGKWATFKLAGELFGLRVEEVQEVLMPQPLTPVPLAPREIVGLLNLRGQIMPAIELRRSLGHPPREENAGGGLLVVKGVDCLISVAVDEIGDVLELSESEWQAPPDTLPEEHRRLVFGICPIQGAVVLGLRIDALGGEGERASPRS